MNKFLIVLITFILIPPVILLGFFICQQYDVYFRTPMYQKYGLPTRTTFFFRCQIYSSFPIEKYKVVIGYDTDWHQCSDYKKYLEGEEAKARKHD